MVTLVNKWGNSLAIRLPKRFADQLGIKEGTQVTVRLNKSSIEIKPVFTLESLVAQMGSGDAHPETEWGEPVGDEV